MSPRLGGWFHKSFPIGSVFIKEGWPISCKRNVLMPYYQMAKQVLVSVNPSHAASNEFNSNLPGENYLPA